MHRSSLLQWEFPHFPEARTPEDLEMNCRRTDVTLAQKQHTQEKNDVM